MGLWLLTNTASEESAELRLTNSDNTKITDSETAGLDNVRGGPRSLTFGKVSPIERRIVYLNRNTPMSVATHFVGARFAEVQGKAVALYGWGATYPASPTTFLATTDFQLSFCGHSGQDWCVALSNPAQVSNAYAVAIGTAAVTIGQCFFAAGQEFDYRNGSLEFQMVPVWAPAVFHAGNFYKLLGTAKFGVIALSRDAVDDYLSLPKNDAVFFYDDTGGDDYGDFLPHKLWHCFITEEVITEHFDDFYGIDFTVGIIKHGNG